MTIDADHLSLPPLLADARLIASTAVQQALHPEHRQAILEAFGPPTEAGRGMTVADVLCVLESHDAHAAWADVVYDTYGPGLLEQLHVEGEGEHYVRIYLVAFTVQALCMLEQGVPALEAVERLVRAAMRREVTT